MSRADVNPPGATARLDVSVSDFGPIRKCEFDLRPLTVFVGPSNSGKSYLAILIYALHRSFRERDVFSRPSHQAWLEGMRRDVIDPPLKGLIQLLAAIEPGRTKGPIVVPQGIADLIVPAFVVGRGDPCKEVFDCFGLEGIDLVRKGAAAGKVLYRSVPPSAGPVFEHAMQISEKSTSSVRPLARAAMEIPIPDVGALERLRGLARRLQGRASRDEYWYVVASEFVEALRSLTLPYIAAPLHLPAFYLPADRTGVMHGLGAFVSGLVGGGAKGGPRRAVLTGVLRDFFQELIELGGPEGDRVLARDHAARIERAMLDGSVNVRRDSSTGYPSFTFQPQGWKDDLPIKNASSMVSELAPVVSYLRHLVLPGNLLIVEEPEAHLHPGMQVEFTRLLAGIVKSGVRVLLTTHSEWVLEELSNVVLASRLTPEQRTEVPAGEFALAEEDVGVWRFDRTENRAGTVVSEIRLAESGELFSESYDDVSSATYNDWVRIGNLAGDHS